MGTQVSMTVNLTNNLDNRLSKSGPIVLFLVLLSTIDDNFDIDDDNGMIMT